MKTLISVLLLVSITGCAGGKGYAVRGDLQADPGSKEIVTFSASPQKVYPVLYDMTAACLGSSNIRVSGEAPDTNGNGGSISIATVPGMFKAKLLATTTLLPTQGGGTMATIYSSSDTPPTGLSEKYRRWIDRGVMECRE